MNIDKIIKEEIGRLNETAGKNMPDTFFDQVVQKLGGTPTQEKRRFFRAWKAAEDTNAKNNPLATTLKLKTSHGGSTDMKDSYNNGQPVQEYKTMDAGVDATVWTLQNTYGGKAYQNLVDKLKSDDVTAEELAAEKKELATWSMTAGNYVADQLGPGQVSTKTATTNNNKNIAMSVGGTNIDVNTYLSGGASFTKEQLEILYREWNPENFQTLKKQYKATAHVYPYEVEKDALIPTDVTALERDYGILLNLTVKQLAQGSSNNIVDVEYMFFPDNSAFINFKGARKFFEYTIDQSNIEIKFKNGDQRVLSIENGKIVSTFTEFANTTQGIVNQIQEIVSWISAILGIAFPGLADIIDILNAIAYYVQGKWLDGHLEMIAAIPMVGGVISRGLKLSLKGFEKAGKTLFKGSKLDPRAVSELLTIAKVKGYVTAGQLKMISSSIDPIIENLTKGSKFRNALDQYTPAQAAKYIDDIVDNLKILTKSGLASSSKTAADVIRAAGSTAQKRGLFSNLFKPQILIKAFSKSADKIDDVINSAMKQVPDKTVTKLKRAAKQTFIKTLTSSPEILALLLKTIPRKKLTSTLANILANKKTNIASEIALKNNKAFSGFVAFLRKNENQPLDTKQLIEFLRKNPNMINDLIKTMLDKQSLMRKLYKKYGKVFYDTQYSVIYSKQMSSLEDLASTTARRITRKMGLRWWGELVDLVEDLSISSVTDDPVTAAAANAAGFSTDLTIGGFLNQKIVFNDDPTGINTPEIHENIIFDWFKRQTMDIIFD